jgi:peptidoglycan hydrolase-like protein with peptidoglycan-binding domain
MKKIIKLTESQLITVIKKVIKEQRQMETPEIMKAKQYYLKKHGYTKNIPDFKVDGVYGESTKKAIQNFHNKLGVWPQDGIWGEETFKKMNKSQINLYKEYVAGFGGFLDKVLHSLGLD